MNPTVEQDVLVCAEQLASMPAFIRLAQRFQFQDPEASDLPFKLVRAAIVTIWNRASLAPPPAAPAPAPGPVGSVPQLLLAPPPAQVAPAWHPAAPQLHALGQKKQKKDKPWKPKKLLTRHMAFSLLYRRENPQLFPKTIPSWDHMRIVNAAWKRSKLPEAPEAAYYEQCDSMVEQDRLRQQCEIEQHWELVHKRKWEAPAQEPAPTLSVVSQQVADWPSSPEGPRQVADLSEGPQRVADLSEGSQHSADSQPAAKRHKADHSAAAATLVGLASPKTQVS